LEEKAPMTAIDHSKICAVVLAGGKATRLGGGDKPLRLLGGKPILDHVLARLRPQIGALTLNANGDAARFSAYYLPIVPDSLADHPGPLAGILAGLDWAHAQGLGAQESGAQDMLSVPGDCPFLPHDLVERLWTTRRSSGLALVCAASNGWTHPVIGLWPLSIRDALRQALLAGERKIDRFTARFGCASAEWGLEEVEGGTLDPFFNVNTPDELQQAERFMAKLGG
jgi:molybdenum cofactor guanylyltransferase